MFDLIGVDDFWTFSLLKKNLIKISNQIFQRMPKEKSILVLCKGQGSFTKVEHPEGGGECPRQSDNERDRKAPPVFLSGDEFEPERKADERQWPPAPRREARCDE